MYDELVKRLRDMARSDGNIKSNYIGLSLLQAADAIEELQKENDELLFRCGQAEAMIDHYQAEEDE